MIAQVRGTIVAKSPVELVIDCNGVGYAVSVSTATSERVPAIGEATTLLTMRIVREDSDATFRCQF